MNSRSHLGALNCNLKRHIKEGCWKSLVFDRMRALTGLITWAQPIFNANEEKEIFICCEKSAFHYKKRVREQPLALLGWNRKQRKNKGFPKEKSDAISLVLVWFVVHRNIRHWLKTLSRLNICLQLSDDLRWCRIWLHKSFFARFLSKHVESNTGGSWA